MCIFSLFALCATTISPKNIYLLSHSLWTYFQFFFHVHSHYTRIVITQRVKYYYGWGLKAFHFRFNFNGIVWIWLLLLLLFVSNIYHIECMYGVVCMWSTLLFVGYLNLVTNTLNFAWIIHSIDCCGHFFSISVNLEFMELFAHFYLTDQWIYRDT